jgi:hypothetical protein
MSNALDQQVLHRAQQIVYLAKWHYLEDRAVARLANVPEIGVARLVPGSRVVQVVTFDGRYIGRIRLVDAHSRHARWWAKPSGHAPVMGPYRSVKAAARALARPLTAPDPRRTDLWRPPGRSDP